MDRADQGVSAEDLSLFLIEMFPNIPIEVVLEKVNKYDLLGSFIYGTKTMMSRTKKYRKEREREYTL
jgi:hypothetical protein